MNSENATFWEHLEDLRWVFVRCVTTAVVVAVVVFCMKDLLFSVVLGPARGDFVTYRLIGVEMSDLTLVNTVITEQFMVHLRTAFFASIVLVSPYLVYEVFRFISPALYAAERRSVIFLGGGAYLMFMIGLLVNYFIIFPVSLRFLASYQVDSMVGNMLTLQSYTDTFLSMSFLVGLVFELPVVSVLLSYLGLVDAALMGRFRRHAIVAVFIVAAIITPTTDAFTLMIVALPILLLYELSILLVKVNVKK